MFFALNELNWWWKISTINAWISYFINLWWVSSGSISWNCCSYLVFGEKRDTILMWIFEHKCLFVQKSRKHQILGYICTSNFQEGTFPTYYSIALFQAAAARWTWRRGGRARSAATTSASRRGWRATPSCATTRSNSASRRASSRNSASHRDARKSFNWGENVFLWK